MQILYEQVDAAENIAGIVGIGNWHLFDVQMHIIFMQVKGKVLHTHTDMVGVVEEFVVLDDSEKREFIRQRFSRTLVELSELTLVQGRSFMGADNHAGL